MTKRTDRTSTNYGYVFMSSYNNDIQKAPHAKTYKKDKHHIHTVFIVSGNQLKDRTLLTCTALNSVWSRTIDTLYEPGHGNGIFQFKLNGVTHSILSLRIAKCVSGRLSTHHQSFQSFLIRSWDNTQKYRVSSGTITHKPI